MSQAIKKLYTPEEYLALEEVAEYKNEYYQGEIFAMAGGSVNHNLIAGNIYTALNLALKKTPFRAFINDMRVMVKMTKQNEFYTYPDVFVVCGKIELAEGRSDTITNPVLIIEVLSKSTEAHDRGDKFRLYQSIPTLQEYILVEQSSVYIDCYHKAEHRSWSTKFFDSTDQMLKLKSIEIEIPVAEIYDRIEFEINKS